MGMGQNTIRIGDQQTLSAMSQLQQEIIARLQREGKLPTDPAARDALIQQEFQREWQRRSRQGAEPPPMGPLVTDPSANSGSWMWLLLGGAGIWLLTRNK